MPTAPAVRRSPRLGSSVKRSRRCKCRAFLWCAARAFHAGRLVSGLMPAVILELLVVFVSSSSGCPLLLLYSTDKQSLSVPPLLALTTDNWLLMTDHCLLGCSLPSISPAKSQRLSSQRERR